MRASYIAVGMAALLVSIGTVACSPKGKGEAVSLAINFTQAAAWTYDFSCVIRGCFNWPDSTGALVSELDCRLRGHREAAANTGSLVVVAESVLVKSNFLAPEEAENIRRQITGSRLPVRFNGTMPVPEDSITLPMFGLGEWDIYRQLAKVAPALPEGKVKPGYIWERERKLPLSTSFGTASCNLYQSFTFDSLFSAGSARYAAISWRFRYAVSPPDGDSLDIIDNLPRAGTGEGRAVIDVGRALLMSAEVDFVTPEAAFRDVNVRWEERIRLMIVE